MQPLKIRDVAKRHIMFNQAVIQFTKNRKGSHSRIIMADENAKKEEAVDAPKAEVENTTPEVKEEVKVEEAPKAEEAPVEEAAPVVEETPVVEEEEEVKEEAPKAEYQLPDLNEAPVDFDFDNVQDENTIIVADDDQDAAIYEKTLKTITEQQVVKGTIMSKNSREVVINIGFKSDGVLSVNELRYMEDIKIGDEVDVYIESQEDVNGQLILSHKKARILKSWDNVNEAHEKDEIINGFVKCRTKGGLIVDVFGIEAFLPGSQIDVKPIRDYDIYVGKNMEFKVVKINNEFKNVVVSHKALIQDELEKQRAEIMAKLEKGQVLEGTVKNITSYGVFIDLGGVDGLVHITDLSWGRINHPEEVVTLDQKINVVILDFDEGKKRIALGLKQLTPHPWDSLDAELKVEDKIKGKVVVIADYGAFVEIAPGVEGLVHVSEMSWSQHLRTAQDFLKVGDMVDAVILTLDREERKMSLGIKQLIPDPWANIDEKYPKGTKHMSTVRNFTNFGIFVELEEGVDGLVHISDLSWSKKIKHPAEFTKIGEQMEVVVLDVDMNNRRLSLGHKQLEENPWDVFETVFNVNSIHKGTITSINDKGAIVALPYGVEGFTPKRHLSKEDGSMPKVDETLDFMVIEFSKDNKKIILSHNRINKQAEAGERSKANAAKRADAKATSSAMKNVNKNQEKTTLGDLGVLETLKAEMQESEKAKAEELLKKIEAKEDAKDDAK